MIPSGPYSLASCHAVLKLVPPFGTITEPLLDGSSGPSDAARMKHLDGMSVVLRVCSALALARMS